MGRRNARLNSLLKREISQLLERTVNDPRLCGLISITDVSVSPDLEHAKVFVSILGNEADKGEVLKGFDAASGFLRKELASRLTLKCVPKLSFYCDDSIERGSKLLKLMEQVSSSRTKNQK
jgi:ribosome-binding factor A